MGTCASIHYPTDRATLSVSTTAIVIHAIDDKLQEFRQPITAGNVLSDQRDTYFLCSAESMFVNCHVPHVSGDEQLQLGQIYFIMPIAKSYRPISLQDICLLAIKASFAIERSGEAKKMSKTTSFGGRRNKRNGSGRGKYQKVDFQVALKMLGEGGGDGHVAVD